MKIVAAILTALLINLYPCPAQDDKLVFTLQGNITDVVSKQPIEGAIVSLVGSDESVVEVITDKNGFYFFDHKPKSRKRYMLANTTYGIYISKEGYKPSQGQETTVGSYESTTFIHDFGLEPAD